MAFCCAEEKKSTNPQTATCQRLKKTLAASLCISQALMSEEWEGGICVGDRKGKDGRERESEREGERARGWEGGMERNRDWKGGYERWRDR